MKRLFENGFPQGKDALLSPQPLFQAGVHSTTILETEGTKPQVDGGLVVLTGRKPIPDVLLCVWSHLACSPGPWSLP